MTYSITDGFFVDDTTHEKTRTILNARNDTADAEWAEKQKASESEYEVTHMAEGVPATIGVLYSLFRKYIAGAIQECRPADERKPLVLDVGCGISPQAPQYIVGPLEDKIHYIGLDPIAKNPKRDFLFLNSQVETLEKVIHPKQKFDVFLFSTSLDHFRDIADVANRLKKFAHPGSLAIFFVGLHDPNTVAASIGSSAFESAFTQLGVGSFVKHYAKTVLRFPKLYLAMRQRATKLRKKQPLDNLHFHYFTKNNIRTSLSLFGEVIDEVVIPGSNAYFATVRML